MRLFKYELYKIVTKKLFWSMLAAALAVNVLALWFLNRPNLDAQLPHSEVKEVFDTLRSLPLSQKLAWLNEETDLMDAYNNREHYLGSIMHTDVSWWHQDEWWANYIEELRERHEADIERFGERLEEDLPWMIIHARRQLYSAIIHDLTVNTYTAYLDRIDAEANMLLGSAIFGGDPDSFSSRNIKITQQDFAEMRGTEIRYDVHSGVRILFDSPSADIIVIFLLVIICIILITDEKDKRLFLIVKSTPKGHIHTIIAKLGALAVSVIFVSVLVFMSGVVFAEYTYGLGDISRSIQSVPVFMGSTLSVSVAGFMGVYLAVKTVALVCTGMAIMLIAIHARHAIILIGITILAAAANTALSAIPLISGLNILRFLNLYSLIRPHKVFGDYFNLDILGSPVRVAPVFIIFGVIMFVLFAALVCVSYLKKHALESNLELFKFKRRGKRALLPEKVHAGYKFYEFKKLAFNNKALLILIVFVIIQAYNVYNMRQPYLGWGHNYQKEYLLSLQGPMTREKHDNMLEERRKLDEAQREIDRVNQLQWRGEIEWFEAWEILRPHYDTQNSMWGFDEVFERFIYVRDTQHARFVYDAGYARLFGLNIPDAGLTGGMWLIAIMILALSGVFPMEYKTGMYKILNASPRGHADTVRLKLLLSAGTMVVAFIIASLTDLIYVGRFFGYGGISAPLASIPPAELGSFPAFLGGVPILVYIAFIMLLRLFFFTGIMLIILAISLRIRHNAYAILVSSLVLLFPLVMYSFGLHMMGSVSVAELITTNGLITAPSAFKGMQVLVFLIASAVSGWYVIRRFGKT
jgi:hypothetical protein